MGMEHPPTLVTDGAALSRVLEEAAAASRVAVDLEGNGLFAYRAKICTLQLAWEGQGGQRVAIVDALECEPRLLKGLLEAAGPVKVVHDVAFDARMLCASGVMLDNVHDTALCASMLGRAETGLSGLLRSELGIQVDKAMQLADWGARPLGEEALAYLAEDVRHLLRLDEVLWEAAGALGIVDEVQTETAHRLATACEDKEERAPAFARIRRLDKLSEAALSVLAEVAEVREQLAMQADVPPFRITTDAALLELARRQPATEQELRRCTGPGLQEPWETAFLEAVRGGAARGQLRPEQAAWLQRPSFDRKVAERLRAREKRLSRWREAEAKRRGVNPQVVLPGHCLRRLAAAVVQTAADVAQSRGMGASRAARYGEQLAEMLREEAAG